MWRLKLLFLLVLLSTPVALMADGAVFDLSGPSLRVTVTRGAATLPLADVPSLKAGDVLSITPEMPATQEARYLLIVSFLRGATNPPPEEWFSKLECWTDDARAKGLKVTVPTEAEQMILFLAPVTGGDYSTLRQTVRGKPGAFVRSAQDLEAANLQRARLNRYLDVLQKIAANDPRDLRKQAPLLAKTLKIKLDEDCFDKPVDQQSSCLTQNAGNMVLDDGATQSMVAEIASGSNVDLIGHVSETKLAGGGAYSPYFGAIVDVARIFGNMHTAKYQYIPAISVSEGEQVKLMLNNPPSFRNPKSVIVFGAPRIAPFSAPSTVAATTPRCAQAADFALPLEGSPLLFATTFAHDLRMSAVRITRENGVEKRTPLTTPDGKPLLLEVVADSARGGFVLKDPKALPADFYGEVKLSGQWGFEPWEGPSYRVTSSGIAETWRQPAANTVERMASYLTAGENNTLRLSAPQAECLASIAFADAADKPLTWKSLEPGVISVELPLAGRSAGPVSLVAKLHGVDAPQKIELTSYANALKIAAAHYHVGEQSVTLTGDRLELITRAGFGDASGVNLTLLPGERLGGEITLRSKNAPPSYRQGDEITLTLELADGRLIAIKTTVEAAQPQARLLSKQVRMGSNEAQARIRLGDVDDLPMDGSLSFFLASEAAFTRALKVEIATLDGGSSTTLSLADGSLMLQDAHTVRGELQPRKMLGSSAFGQLRYRILDGPGGIGSWQPLAHLVRLPKVSKILCPEALDKPCRLLGDDLFLIDALSATEGFKEPLLTPPGFTASALESPRPSGALLYLKLRDDPTAVHRLLAPVLPQELDAK